MLPTSPPLARLSSDPAVPATFDAAYAFQLLQWVADDSAGRWQALYGRRTVPAGVLTRDQRHMSEDAAQRRLHTVQQRASLLYHALRWLEVGTPRSLEEAQPSLVVLPTLIEFLTRAAVFHEPAHGRVEYLGAVAHGAWSDRLIGHALLVAVQAAPPDWCFGDHAKRDLENVCTGLLDLALVPRGGALDPQVAEFLLQDPRAEVRELGLRRVLPLVRSPARPGSSLEPGGWPGDLKLPAVAAPSRRRRP